MTAEAIAAIVNLAAFPALMIWGLRTVQRHDVVLAQLVDQLRALNTRLDRLELDS